MTDPLSEKEKEFTFCSLLVHSLHWSQSLIPQIFLFCFSSPLWDHYVLAHGHSQITCCMFPYCMYISWSHSQSSIQFMAEDKCAMRFYRNVGIKERAHFLAWDEDIILWVLPESINIIVGKDELTYLLFWITIGSFSTSMFIIVAHIWISFPPLDSL